MVKRGDNMPGVAVNNSSIEPSIREEYVRYRVYYWDIVDEYCAETDPETGNCFRWEYDWDWVYSHTSSTGARITGTVIASSKMRVGGNIVAVVGNRTNESWEAFPAIPDTIPGVIKYEPINDISGRGNGTIVSGSSKLRIGGNPVALIGSQVTTHLGTTTTISTGNSKINVAS